MAISLNELAKRYAVPLDELAKRYAAPRPAPSLDTLATQYAQGRRPSFGEQVRAVPGELARELRLGEGPASALAGRGPIQAFIDYPLSVLNIPFRAAGIAARDISAYGGAGIARLGQKVGLNLGPTDPREVAALPLVRGIEQAAEVGASVALPIAAARAAARPRLSAPPGSVLEAQAKAVIRRSEPDLQAPTPASITATVRRPGDIPSVVSRISEKGQPASRLADVAKPHGLYTSPADVISPHADLGGPTAQFRTNPSARALRLDATDLVETNRGRVGQSAGIAALRQLVGDQEASRLLRLPRPELTRFLQARYPNIAWSRYFDTQEMLEVYGAQQARKAGYDAIWAIDRSAPEFSEYVGLNRRAFQAPSIRPAIIRRAEPDLQAPTPASVTASPAGLVQPATAQPVHRTVAERAADLFLQQRGLRDPKRLISDQITDLLTTDKLHIRDIEQLLGQSGLTVREFAEGVFRPSIRRAAQTLGILGRVERQILAIERANPAEATRLRDLARGLDEYAKARGMWERLGNIWRGSLVGQSATAARNLAVTVGRAGLDVIEAGWDQGVGLLTGTTPKSSPMEGVQVLLNMLWRPRGAARNVEAVLRRLPSEHDRMFATFASELSAKAGPGSNVLSAGEKVVHWANVFNRGQEFLSRRAIFQAHLDQRLRSRGLSLEEAVRANRLDDLPADDIAASITKALDITFGTRTKFANAWSGLLDAIPGPLRLIPQTIIPFPNFLAQSLRFFAEYSPLGFLKLLSPAERAAIAAGEMRAVSRALVGTGLLGAAYELRKSPQAGERWYEVRASGGRTIDLRPYNPLASYLYVADLIVRHQDGRLALSPPDLKDVLQATLTANVRGGTSLDFVNNMIDWAQGGARAGARAARYGGEFVAGFPNPLRTLTDAMAEFGAFPKDVRETRTEPFAGPIKARLPGLAETLPEAESPTRGGPIVREAPLLRQATGITLTQAKNPAEAELDRLGITRGQVLPSTGIPELDRARTKVMGPVVERVLGRIVQTPRYHAFDDARKTLVVTEALKSIRRTVGAQVRAQQPDLWARYRYDRLPIHVREILREEGVGVPTR